MHRAGECWPKSASAESAFWIHGCTFSPYACGLRCVAGVAVWALADRRRLPGDWVLGDHGPPRSGLYIEVVFPVMPDDPCAPQ